MAAMTLVVPVDTALRLPSADNSLQLGLTVALITLLISGSSISAALSDRKLQSKEHDLRRVNVLLSQLDRRAPPCSRPPITMPLPTGQPPRFQPSLRRTPV